MIFASQNRVVPSFHRIAIRFTLALSFVLLGIQRVPAGDTAARLQTSVARLNHWLRTGPNAQAWNEALHLNLLDSQTAQGAQADAQKLRSILARFNACPSALQYPIFRDVFDSIRAHAEQIQRAQSGQYQNLSTAALGSINDFQSTRDQLDSLRYHTIGELLYLKQLYQRDASSQERNDKFQEIELDQTIQFLRDLNIDSLYEPAEPSATEGSAPVANGDADDDDDGAAEPDRTGTIYTLDRIDFVCRNLDVEGEGKRLTILRQLCTIRARFQNALNPLELQSLGPIIEDVTSKPLKDLERFKDLKQAAPELEEILGKLGTDPALLAAYEALDRFTEKCRFATEPNARSQFPAKVARLADLLPALHDSSQTLAHAEVGAIVQWLESRLQLPDLCTAIKRRHSQPNLQLSISGKFIQKLIDQLVENPFSETSPVAECVLGRFARGFQSTTNTVSLVPIFNPDQMHIAVQLDGKASTDTYVFQRKLRIDSAGTGCLSARRELFVGLGGLTAAEISANAVMRNRFDGTSSKLRLINRIANRAFNKNLPAANAIAERTAEKQLKERFAEETTSLMEPANDVLGILSNSILRLGRQVPPSFLNSSSIAIGTSSKRESWNHLAALTPPSFPSNDDIQVKVHESLINAYLSEYFSGLTDFTDAKFRSLMNQIPLQRTSRRRVRPGIPRPSIPRNERPEVLAFTMSFHEIQPFAVHFDKNLVTIIVHGTKFEDTQNAERKIDGEFTIEFPYRVELDGIVAKLVLDSKPRITFLETGLLSVEMQETKNSLEEQLHREQKQHTLKLTSSVQALAELLELDKSLFQFNVLEMRGGWLYVGWNP